MFRYSPDSGAKANITGLPRWAKPPGQSARDPNSYRAAVEQRHVLPNPAWPSAQARRAKVRNIGYGLPSEFELNFGRRLPALARADDDNRDT
jgi:hypothetical protein